MGRGRCAAGRRLSGHRAEGRAASGGSIHQGLAPRVLRGRRARAVPDDWRRAVGIAAVDAGAEPAETAPVSSPAIEERRRPSVVRQLDRAIDRLVRAAGRLEMPEGFRLEAARILELLVAIREKARHARGDARRALLEHLASVDQDLTALARQAEGGTVAQVEAEAQADLAPYRARLGPVAWRRSLDASVDRTLRDRFGLPSLNLDIPSS